MNRLIIKFAGVLLLLVLLIPTNLAFFCNHYTAFLIDETYQPRDSEVKTITLTSDYPSRKAVLYATVNEITADSEGEIKEFVTPVMTDRTNTVTSWAEITRGRIELMPGEKIEVPSNQIHPYAEPESIMFLSVC